MRPVNLIPPEERRGESAPARAGAASYVLVGVLCAVLVGMVLLTTFGNTVNEREAEAGALRTEAAELSARAQSLQVYTNFEANRQNRVQTIAALARSRFDWERVLEELSRVMPIDIRLTSLTGSVNPSQEKGTSNLRGQSTGPALTMSGVATSHVAVAEFITLLEQIDGVTRVAVEKSVGEEQKDTLDVGGKKAQNSIPQFNIGFDAIAVFDAVPVPPGAVPKPLEPPTPGSAGEPVPTGAGDDNGGVDEVQVGVDQAKESIDGAKQKTDRATAILGAGGE